MINLNMWIILGIVAIILLIIYWRSRNAVWGGLTMGIIFGLIVAISYLFRGYEFNWYIIGKSATIGTIVGFGAELLGKISSLLRKK